ncbi:hypothetical protein KAR91_88465 [Candidatus Pacearchaeota archaeon]|nr:hypothetical protein [Candidatus Pacearchaeota archaeon]
MPTPFAISQLAKKLRLEASVIPKLNKFFRKISATIRPVWNSTGRVPDVSVFQDELVELLTKHYDRVAKAFHKDALDEFKKSLPVDMELKQEAEEAVDESADRIDDMLLLIIAARASTQSGIILNTVQNELDDAVETTAKKAAKAGVKLSPSEQGRQIERDFENRIPGKSNLVAMSETQGMAEDTKLTEAEALLLAGVVINGVAVAIAMKKVWDAILDDRTRPAHVSADGQVRGMGVPFIVAGEMLKVPGDTSLGASAGNIINCRCSARYTLFI